MDVVVLPHDEPSSEARQTKVGMLHHDAQQQIITTTAAC